MSETPLDARLETLFAKQEIYEVLMRYCRGVDRMDEALVRSCYHPDAIDEHGSFKGGVGEYIAFVWKLMPRYDVTMHFIGNVLIEPELASNVARSEAYCIAHHRQDGGPPASNLATGCRYIDRFERRGGGAWLIAKRIVTTEWIRHDIPEVQFPIKETLRTGQRDRSDPVYEPIS